MFTLTYISAILFVTTALNCVLTFTSWQRANTSMGRYFTLGMTGVTFWTLASAFGYAVVPISLKVFFATLEAWGYMLAHPSFTLFALSFAGYGRWLDKKWVKALFLLVPASNLLLVSTNPWHGWLWIGFIRGANNTVIFEHGPAFVWIWVSSNLMTLLIIWSCWRASNSGSEISRQQGRLLLYAILVPVSANLLYVLGISPMRGVDWTSVTFSVTGFLFLRALYGSRLLDIIPIARDQLVGSLADGIIVLDLQGRIIDINHAAGQMLGLEHSTLLGQNASEVLSLPDAFLHHPLEQDVNTELEFGGTTRRYYDVLLSPLHDGRNKLLGRLVVFRNITERKENELRLLQLTQAVEQSQASVLITDPNGLITYVNPQFSILTGYSQRESIGRNPNILQSGQTPDKVYKDMWQTIQSGQPWQGEFLNRKKDGELYWENAVIAPVLDQAGHILNFIAVKEDITKRKAAEAALRNSEERFRQLVMSAPDAVFGIDQHGKIVFANHQACNMLGYDEDELAGQSIEILVPESFRDGHIVHRSYYHSHPSTRVMRDGSELSARHKNGHVIPVEINLSYSITEKGPLVIAHMRDVGRRKRAEDALRHANQQLEQQLREIEQLQSTLREQAVRDPLTQLHNRRYLDDAMEQEFHHARRVSENLAVILLDIDRFKTINDTYGHAVGDACLVALANLIRRNVRRSDISCRYGGEEFMLLLPATDVNGAVIFAEKLRMLAGREIIKIAAHEIKLTLSIGVAVYPMHGDGSQEIINRADGAMYLSKRAGRNCVTLWTPTAE